MIKNVIIVAGGSGKRMKADIPKQFMLLRKKPVLMHSIDAFFQFDKNINIVLALPGNQFDYWKELCTGYAFTTPHTLVKGGETRFQSVKNSLNEITSVYFSFIERALNC